MLPIEQGTKGVSVINVGTYYNINRKFCIFYQKYDRLISKNNLSKLKLYTSDS